MTPPTPPRDTAAGRAYNDLRNLARRQKRDPAEYITLYALEGFLIRLTASEFAEDFVLKGGMLMPAFAARRPKRFSHAFWEADFVSRAIQITWCLQKKSSLRSNAVSRILDGATSPRARGVLHFRVEPG